MTKTLATIEEVRALAIEAETLAPWMPTRIENIRGTVKRNDLSDRELQNCANALRLDMRIARQRLAEGKRPRHIDILDASGRRPRPYVGEHVTVGTHPGVTDAWAGRRMRVVKRSTVNPAICYLAPEGAPVDPRSWDVAIGDIRLQVD